MCQSGTCVRSECTPGQLDCTCGPDATCDYGLECQSGTTCVVATGDAGGACLADNTCRQGNGCVDGFCVPCDVGSPGCSCYSSGLCLDGAICVSGTCVSEPSQVMAPPADPQCYSPCLSDVVVGGAVVSCPAEKLIPLCLDRKQCIAGSCVESATEVASCVSDIDCPDYQACMQGRCYSNCEGNSDCPTGLECHRKVCRVPCDTGGEDCGDGHTCITFDGQHGYCEPVSEPQGAPRRAVEGSFTVTPDQIQLSNLKLSTVFEIVNLAPRALEFTVRKEQHIEPGADGPTYERDNPLPWLWMGVEGSPVQTQSFKVLVDGNGGSVRIQLDKAANDLLPAWEGTLVVENPELGPHRIGLSYVESPDGRWAGKLYYFTSFGDKYLPEWLAAGRSESSAASVRNAFIQRWSAFRYGRMASLDEFLAVLTATRTGSWDWPQTRAVCPDPDGACYLHEHGVSVYTENEATIPVPAGVVEFPFVVHLAVDQSDTSGATLKGRIDTANTLQYGANPSFTLKFANDPEVCTHSWPGACLVDVALPVPGSHASTVLVGGRYPTVSSDSTCGGATGFVLTQTPWLVPGFTESTGVDADSGRRYRYECRDSLLPYASADSTALNLSFSQANPVPDGLTRRRNLDIIDGALINNDTLFLVFRETFVSFLSSDPLDDFAAYGYILLKRSAADLTSADFIGAEQQDPRTVADGKLGVQCKTDLLDQIGVTSVTPTNAGYVATAVLDGIPTVPAETDFIVTDPPSAPYVHYLCVTSEPDFDSTGKVIGSHAVGYFDGGPGSGGLPPDPANLRECPAGSTVRYFLTGDPMDEGEVANLPCQFDGTCHDQLATWEKNCEAGHCSGQLKLDPLWRCANDAVHCDNDRFDLRSEKLFYKESLPVAPAFVPLRAQIDDAFRYRTRFQNREGTGLGFAPSLCSNGGNALPYCYDPPQIEQAADRVDCLLNIFTAYHADLPTDLASRMLTYLRGDFACEQDAAGACVADGFERLNSELMVMMGDDAYTSAFASRFDLAGSAIYGFEGTSFEPNGIDLSGGAGFEMFKLYQATQYYQQAVDRFYWVLPHVWHAITANDLTQNFVTLGTVTSYLDRVIRASVQKTRAWSEIAKRYQSFNRPDLAQFVVERAYSSAYMESVILNHLMLRMKNTVTTANRPQVAERVRLAALGYASALLDMRKVYDDFTDDVSYFGFPPDYIPFPALASEGGNAFEYLYSSARQKASVAADKEERALATDKSYDTDAVSFQNELTRIRLNYEGQLAETCGTFVGDDGRVYPAIPKYAPMSERTRLLGNPCGFVGNGAAYQAMSSLDVLGLDLRIVLQQAENVQAEMQIEAARAAEQCDLALTLADYQYGVGEDVRSLEHDVNRIRGDLAEADRILRATSDVAAVQKCFFGLAGSDCPAATAAAVVMGVANAINEGAHIKNEKIIREKEDLIAKHQADLNKYTTGEHQCLVLQADSTARINTMALQLEQLDLQALRAEYQIAQALSEVQKQRNHAQQLISEQQETEQQTIDLQVARDDPNTRIYKNDAIITADRTFQDALREAYKATKVYEYYTSQSYAELGKLFLVRMVAHGDISLESYLDGLGNAYAAFGEQFGTPDLRVAIVSMRDDIMQIPRVDVTNRPIPQSEREALFRARLGDSRLLDDRGYTTVPFATSLAGLSPLTRDHKVAYVEAEIIGNDIGDTVGRIYLRQRGTGVVRGVSDETSFYAFPARTAVLDVFFNGHRVFGPEVYRNTRLRDRPMVNTRWEAVLNQRDEQVNQDIDINSVSDVRFYIYYTDLTPF